MNIFKDKYISAPFGISLFSIALLAFFLTQGMPRQSSEGLTIVPLHYNVHFGIDYFDAWFKVFIIPGNGLAIFIINFLLAGFLYKKEKLAAYFLSFGTLFMQIFLFIAGIFILLFNA